MSQKNTAKPKDNFTKYLVIGVVVAVLTIMVIPTVLSKTKPVSQAIPASVSSTDGYAISFNTDLKSVPVVDIYEDFQCPICQQFEALNGQYISSLVKDKKMRSESSQVRRALAILFICTRWSSWLTTAVNGGIDDCARSSSLMITSCPPLS
ncbi:MAG: DsbA family protein, partial [Candidatus Planktophila sp.]